MSNELEKLSTAALCDEIERLDAKATRGQWKAGQHDPYSLMAWEGSQRSNLAVFDPGNAYTGDVELCARYRALAPEAARRLRERDDELKAIAAALDLSPGEHIEGEVLEAIEALQEQARGAEALRQRVAELEGNLSLVKCDMARGLPS